MIATIVLFFSAAIIQLSYAFPLTNSQDYNRQHLRYKRGVFASGDFEPNGSHIWSFMLVVAIHYLVISLVIFIISWVKLYKKLKELKQSTEEEKKKYPRSRPEESVKRQPRKVPQKPKEGVNEFKCPQLVRMPMPEHIEYEQPSPPLFRQAPTPGITEKPKPIKIQMEAAIQPEVKKSSTARTGRSRKSTKVAIMKSHSKRTARSGGHSRSESSSTSSSGSRSTSSSWSGSSRTSSSTSTSSSPEEWRSSSSSGSSTGSSSSSTSSGGRSRSSSRSHGSAASRSTRSTSSRSRSAR